MTSTAVDVIAVGTHTPAEVLHLAASVDRLSAHVLGEALVRAARDAELALAPPSDVREEPGQGITGRLDGHRITVGSRAFLRADGYDPDEVADAALVTGHGSGEAHVLVGVDGPLAGVIVMADELRRDADRIVERLRAEGVRHVAMVSGDRRSVAERIGRELAFDRVYAEQSPEDKLDVVRSLRETHSCARSIMVGDGVNDAPALAIADLGIAMGARARPCPPRRRTRYHRRPRRPRRRRRSHGRRALFIARQSVLAGMGLSIVAMGVAAAGYLPPVAGALFQEVIDLAVILNALRALRG